MASQLILLCSIVLLLVSISPYATEAAADRKYATKKNLRLPLAPLPPTPVMSFDDASDVDEDSLFYNADLLTEDKPEPAEPSALDTLLLEIMQTTNGTSVEKCAQYKAQIGDICMSKFVQRTRFRLEEPLAPFDSALVDAPKQSTAESSAQPSKRPTSLLAPAQQICCEFRTTYLRCLLTSINFVCPLTEFNELYTQVQGLSELCSRFYGKSLKKCRKRYNRKQQPQPQAHTTVAPVEARTVTFAPQRK